MQVACLSHSRSGTCVRISEVPWPVLVAERAGGRVFGLAHWLAREWTFHVRWGPADGEGYCARCLGNVLLGFGNWGAGGFGLCRREREVASIPVSYEFVRQHWPDAGGPWDGSWDDEDASLTA